MEITIKSTQPAPRPAPVPNPTSGIFVLRLNGKFVKRGRDSDLWGHLQKSHPYSVQHALAHEGYSIEPATPQYWLQVARTIKEEHRACFVSRVDGARCRKKDEAKNPVLLDALTASMLCAVVDGIGEDQRNVFLSLPLMSAIKVSWQLVI